MIVDETELCGLLAEAFRHEGKEAPVVTVRTTRESCPEWDSLSHMRMMIRLETRYRVRFGTQEIGEQMNSVAEILVLLSRRESAPKTTGDPAGFASGWKGRVRTNDIPS